jgi:hypothetical protein
VEGRSGIWYWNTTVSGRETRNKRNSRLGPARTMSNASRDFSKWRDICAMTWPFWHDISKNVYRP